MNNHKELLKLLSEAPDSQICVSQTDKFRIMAERDTSPSADEIKEILDACAYASLASDFAMLAMDHLWKTILKEEAEVQ